MRRSDVGDFGQNRIDVNRKGDGEPLELPGSPGEF